MDSEPKDLARTRILDRLSGALDLPAGFFAMAAEERLDAILALRDPGRFLRSLRPDEAYHLMRGIGLEEARGLLPYLSPDQRRSLADYEAWAGDRYLPERFDRLLDMALAVSTDVAISMVRETDGEQIALHVLGRARLDLVREVDDPPDNSFPTPDGTFLVCCQEEADVPSVRRLIDLLFAVGVEYAHRVLQAGRFDTASSLEDQAARFREARLSDLGFPPDRERFSLWEPIDRAEVRRRLGIEAEPVAFGETSPLALVLATTEAPPFFWQALAAAAAGGRAAAVMDGILYLVNRVLAARGADLHDDSAWEGAAAHAVPLVSLGLEELARGDVARAGDALRRLGAVEMYRCGVERIRPIHLHAKRIVAGVGGTARLDLFDPPVAETIRAALQFPPQLYEGLLDPGGIGRRDFRSGAEVERARTALTGAWAVLRFAGDVLGFRADRAGPTRGVTFANVFATAWARQVLGGDPVPDPLDEAEVGDLLVAAFHRKRIRAPLRKGSSALAARADDPLHRAAVAAFLDQALDAVQDALGGLDPSKPVDLRFLGNSLLLEER